MLFSRRLREKLFWKHLLDTEYSKMGLLSCYLFKGTAGVGVLLTAVTSLHPFRRFQKWHLSYFCFDRLSCLPYLGLPEYNLKAIRNWVPKAGLQEHPHSWVLAVIRGRGRPVSSRTIISYKKRRMLGSSSVVFPYFQPSHSAIKLELKF